MVLAIKYIFALIMLALFVYIVLSIKKAFTKNNKTKNYVQRKK